MCQNPIARRSRMGVQGISEKDFGILGNESSAATKIPLKAQISLDL